MHWLQTLDASLFRFVNQSLTNPVCDSIMPVLSGAHWMRWFVLLILLVVAVVLWRGNARARLCVLLMVLAVALGDPLVVNTIKQAVARPRPCLAQPDAVLRVGCTDTGSMPSAHAANWFAVTMVGFLFYRRTIRFLFPLALAVSFSRVYNGVHYPGDALAGAILGAGYGAVMVLTLNAAWRWAGARWFPLWWERMPSLLNAGFGMQNAEPEKSKFKTQNSSDSALRTPHSALDAHWLRLGYVLIAVLLVARWAYLASGTIQLSEDEAYQWLWSKHLALSYYSKPPLIAYTQFLGTHLWGDTAFGVRFFSPLIAATLGFLLLRFFAREVSARAGFFLVLIVNTTPLMALGATVMTVDPLSVFFWTAAMLAGWRAVRDGSTTVSWLWVGVWMGFGFLSKYTGLFQWLCWAVFFALWPPARQQLRRPGPYLALLVNLLCALPVLIWNYQHGWITVTHVAENAGAHNPWKFTLKYFIDFVGTEGILLNPFFFIGMVWASAALWRRHRADARLVYLFSMGAPLFLSYLLFTFHSRVLPNWIAPSVLPLFCVMVVHGDSRWRAGGQWIKTWLTAGICLGAFFVVLLHDTNLVAKIAGYPLPPKPDPLTRVRAYSDLAKVVGQARTKLLAEGKPVFIIGNHYGIAGLISFYLPEAKARVTGDPLVFCRSWDKPENQFYFWPGYQGRCKGQNAIFVGEMESPKLVPGWIPEWLAGETNLLLHEVESEPAPPWLLQQFDSVTNLGLHNILYRGRVFHTIQIFECRNLR